MKDISLEISDGEFVVLLGPSGCGKSTLLRIIAGLERQTDGSVHIGNTVADGLSPRERDIAMVFQHYALYPHLSVRENLAFGLKMRKEPKSLIESRINEAADLLEIHHLLDRLPKELSGGQRQRVAMGRAIVRKPKLFLFDEPLSNLDARLRGSMRVELKKLHQRLGVTMIYVTHDQVEAMTLGEKIVIIDHGEIQQFGTPEKIYQEPANPFVAGFIGNPPMNFLKGTLEVGIQGLHFQAGKLAMEFPGVSVTPDSSHVQLGIRPEDIYFEPPPEPTTTIPGNIDVVENLGADLLVYVLAEDQRLIIRCAPIPVRKPGAPIRMYLPHQRLHLFANGHRIGTLSALEKS